MEASWGGASHDAQGHFLPAIVVPRLTGDVPNAVTDHLGFHGSRSGNDVGGWREVKLERATESEDRDVEKMHLSSDIGVISSPSFHPPLLHLHPCIMVFFVTSKGIYQRHMRERQEAGEDEIRLTWNVYRGCWSVRASTHKHTFSHFYLCGDCNKLKAAP